MTTITEILASLQKTFSQSEIARKTGVAQSKLSRWGSGSIPAGADDALKLLELERKTISELGSAMDAAGRRGEINRRVGPVDRRKSSRVV